VEKAAAPAAVPPTSNHPAIQPLLARWASFPEATRPLLLEGLRRLVDYQDPAYATLYLDRLDALRAAPGGDDPPVLTALARHLALWMSYEDTVRVADLKTRGSRFERVRNEVKAEADQPLAIHEYMHPRLQEIAETLPAGLGRWLLGAGWPRRLVARFTQQGRVVRTSSLGGFLMLSAVSGLKRWRRGSLRYALENARIEAWLAQVQAAAARDPQLAVEIIECQRLVRGYCDTFERGLKLYDTLMAVQARAGAAMPPATLRELRVAALADEEGRQLQLTLARHALA
jgi:indolepyruvate ferredoxin oxidoreductase beta subunit